MSDNIIDQGALKRLLEVIGGDPEDLEELVEEFETSGPKTLQTMAQAAESGDLDTLRISSHGLKSNGRDFGALTLAKYCENLEHDCRNGVVENPSSRVDEIAAEFERARNALKSVSLA